MGKQSKYYNTYERRYLDAIKNLPTKRNSLSTPKKKKTNVKKYKQYNVHSVRAHRQTTSEVEFLVRWENYSSEYDSWEPSSNLAPLTLAKYLEKLQTDHVIHDVYDCNEKSQCVTKKNANDFFRHAVVNSKRRGRTVYLEASDANTTKYLQKLKDLELVAVNYDQSVCHHILNNSPIELAIFCGSLRKFLVMSQKHSIFALWMDYCCTFDGSVKQDWSPRSDYLYTIENMKVCPEGVIALTICTRASPKGIPNLADWLLDIAKKKYKRSRVLTRYSYPGMFLLIIRLSI